MKHKKIFINAGALLATGLPVTTAVACSAKNGTSDANDHINYDIPDTVVYNIKDVQSTDRFVDTILQTFQIAMPIPGYDLAPATAEKLEIAKHYIDNTNFHKTKMELVNGNEHYTLDFGEAAKCFKELAQVADLGFANLQKNEKMQLAYTVGIRATGTQAVDYTKVVIDSSDVMALVPFMNMYDNGKVAGTPITQKEYDDDDWGGVHMTYPPGLTMSDPNWPTTPDWDSVTSTHPYLNLLKAYHKVLYTLVQSDFYKNWIKNKTYRVMTNSSPFAPGDTHNLKGEYRVVNSGTQYDLPNSLAYDNTGKHFTAETSNLEFLFIYRLMRLY